MYSPGIYSGIINSKYAIFVKKSFCVTQNIMAAAQNIYYAAL
jgi:hypothetical protein